MDGRSVLENVRRICRFACKNGARKAVYKAVERKKRDAAEKDYEDWLKDRLPDEEEAKAQRSTVFPYEPLISILVPAYETDEKFFREMAGSVLSQSYQNLELCIADGSASSGVERAAASLAAEDPRLKYRKLPKNGGISANTNAALMMAHGDYVGFLDHDDFLLPGALFEIVKALNENARECGLDYADALYTDEDKYDTVSGRHFQPHFKPDFNLESLRTNNYICHFFVVKRERALEVGGFDSAYDGSQDHDFIFRCVEKDAWVLHVRKVLYSWRGAAGSTSTDPESKLYAYEAGKRAVAAHLKRMGERGHVVDTENYGFYRVIYPGQKKNPGKGRENFNRQNCIEVVYYDEVCNNSVTISGEKPYILFTCFERLKVGKGFAHMIAAAVKRPGAVVSCARAYDPDDRLHDNLCISGFDDPFSKGTKGLKEGYTGYFHVVGLQQELESPTGCFLIRRGTVRKLLHRDTFTVGELRSAVQESGGHIYYEPGAVVYGQR